MNNHFTIFLADVVVVALCFSPVEVEDPPVVTITDPELAVPMIT